MKETLFGMMALAGAVPAAQSPVLWPEQTMTRRAIGDLEFSPDRSRLVVTAPYEALDGFIKSSPMTFVKNARTPTLLLQGEDDTTDPIGQSQQFYRGLKRYGVEADLVLYPREPHGLREETHLLDRLTRILAWYDKYLMPAETVTAPRP